jgi:hypothetical protein
VRNTRNYSYFTQDILAEEWKNHLLVTIVAKKNIQLDVARNIHMHITMHAHVKIRKRNKACQYGYTQMPMLNLALQHVSGNSLYFVQYL